MSVTENLAKKKRVRAGHRASAKRSMGRLDAELATSSLDLVKVFQLKRSLEEKIDTLKLLDADLLELLEDEAALTEEIEQADDFKGAIYAAIIKAEKCSSTILSTDHTPAEMTKATISPGNHHVKLPKLALHSFSGDVTQWLTFWDSFKSAIHDNDQLVEIDKFNYLKSLLNGVALEAVSGLTLSAPNYAEAISILEKRFGNRQQIITKHMDQLLNVDPVASPYNLRGLRHLFDSVESHVRCLKSLGVTADSYGSLLSSVLLNKLPPDIRLLVSRKVPEDDWSLDVLLKELEEELQARERVVIEKPSLRGSLGKNERQSQPTAATLVAGVGQMGPICCYCQQEHPSNNCGIVTQIETRKQILRKSGHCFNCLRRGHLSRDCRSRSRCSKCSRKHHVSICSGGNAESGRSSNLAEPIKKEPSTGGQVDQSQDARSNRTGLNANAPSFLSHNTTSLYVTANKTVLLQTALTTVRNPHQPMKHQNIRVVLDLGSQRSYITQRTARALSLEPEGIQKMSIFTFGSTRRSLCDCELVKVVMETLDGEIEMHLLTTPIICEPITTQPISLCANSYKHLSELRLADSSDGNSLMDVDLLVGSDYYWKLTTGRVSRGENGPVAVETRLGWVLSGPIPLVEQSMNLMTTHTLRVDTHEESKLDDTLRAFWELESLGITGSERSVHQEFEESISFKNGRYEVSLPWKHPHPVLPDNYKLSRNRLQSVLRRLCQTPIILQEYDSIIRKQLELGIVQPIKDSDHGEVGNVHYLPHHAVIRQDKMTTKVRVVYDASAKTAGPSLNECLFTGPKFEQRILDILLRFRSYPIALTADIEKAFLMISVSEKDQNVLRFLWVDDIMKPDPDIQVFRFTRVVFGVSSSPFLLNATIDHHLKLFAPANPELVKTLRHSIYVDDVVAGARDESATMKLYEGSKRILQEGGFNLRKFITNAPQLQRAIERKENSLVDSTTVSSNDLDETYAKSTLGCTQTMSPTDQKVLGVKWDVEADHLIFSVREISAFADTQEPTKRKVTSIIGKFYDPLGFLSPVVISFKVFFQELCEESLDWDQVLTGSVLCRWQHLIASLQDAPTFSIPRYFLKGTDIQATSYHLHGFCDASKRAYAAVVYLVAQTGSELCVRFVASKTRVAPLRELSIPRLELMSALLLARLLDNITKSLSLNLSL